MLYFQMTSRPVIAPFLYPQSSFVDLIFERPSHPHVELRVLLRVAGGEGSSAGESGIVSYPLGEGMASWEWEDVGVGLFLSVKDNFPQRVCLE